MNEHGKIINNLFIIISQLKLNTCMYEGYHFLILCQNYRAIIIILPIIN